MKTPLNSKARLALSVVAVLAALIAGVKSPAASAGTPGEVPAFLSGTVKDLTGAPVPNAQVCLDGADLCARTGTDGTYVLKGPASGAAVKGLTIAVSGRSSTGACIGCHLGCKTTTLIQRNKTGRRAVRKRLIKNSDCL